MASRASGDRCALLPTLAFSPTMRAFPGGGFQADEVPVAPGDDVSASDAPSW